jgi:hypothetical protein
MNVITRRQAILTGLGFPGLLAVVPAAAFAPKEFWNEKKPSDWTDAEIHQLLNQSPWAKESSISDTTRRGSLGAPAAGNEAGVAGVNVGERRGARSASTTRTETASTGPQLTWKATVRWESALPVREALHPGAPGELPEDYILNVFGEVPGADPDSGFAILKENTTLEHKGDRIKLNRIEPAPGNNVAEAGTLFYFSRLPALKLEDKEAIFTTKLGPLKVKCKFTLRDMLYRGNLEL